MKLHCFVCQHNWKTKRKGLPKRCPKCRTLRWNQLTFSNRNYSETLKKMSLGDSTVFKWNEKDGFNDEKANESMNNVINRFARKSGVKFFKQPLSYGLMLTRVE